VFAHAMAMRIIALMGLNPAMDGLTETYPGRRGGWDVGVALNSVIALSEETVIIPMGEAKS
jgi:hypothetical protein